METFEEWFTSTYEETNGHLYIDDGEAEWAEIAYNHQAKKIAERDARIAKLKEESERNYDEVLRLGEMTLKLESKLSLVVAELWRIKGFCKVQGWGNTEKFIDKTLKQIGETE